MHSHWLAQKFLSFHFLVWILWALVARTPYKKRNLSTRIQNLVKKEEKWLSRRGKINERVNNSTKLRMIYNDNELYKNSCVHLSHSGKNVKTIKLSYSIKIQQRILMSSLTLFGSGLKIYVEWQGGCLPPPPSKHPKSLWKPKFIFAF